jgi:hypothetical protein
MRKKERDLCSHLCIFGYLAYLVKEEMLAKSQQKDEQVYMAMNEEMLEGKAPMAR